MEEEKKGRGFDGDFHVEEKGKVADLSNGKEGTGNPGSVRLP